MKITHVVGCELDIYVLRFVLCQIWHSMLFVCDMLAHLCCYNLKLGMCHIRHAMQWRVKRHLLYRYKANISSYKNSDVYSESYVPQLKMQPWLQLYKTNSALSILSTLSTALVLVLPFCNFAPKTGHNYTRKCKYR